MYKKVPTSYAGLSCIQPSQKVANGTELFQNLS